MPKPTTLFLPIVILLTAQAWLHAEPIETDLLIVGATESGWAAAIQAARGGTKSITMVHDGEWFGGQFTEQALACVDENKGVGKVGWGVSWHPMKRSFHRSGLFKELIDRIEQFNTDKYGSPMPGKPYHGPSTFRPAEAEAIFREMISPYMKSGQVRVIWKHFPMRAEVAENRLTGLWFKPVTGDGDPILVRAKITIDASDWGEAIQAAGAAFECGPDPKSRYGEPSAPEDLSKNPPNEMNPITWAMIVEESKRETPIEKPARHDDRFFPRATQFSFNEFRGLKWDVANPGLGAIRHWPDAGKASPRQLSVYTVRRIVDGRTAKTGRSSILLNYMNGQDYPLERLPTPVAKALEATQAGASKKNIVLLNRKQREIIFADAKRQSLSVLYHLQNFVHERAADKTNSFRNFHLSDEFGTSDRLPPKPYIRESLRLKAMYNMREQDARNRDGVTKTAARERFAHVMYPDGLFAWQFHYDFHRTGRTYLADEKENGPWIDYHKPNRHTKFMSDRSVFPLRSLVPEKINGLLGAQGNVGFSSIVSAAIRLHDQRIHIGQAAGATAAVAIAQGVDCRTIPFDRTLLEKVRDQLCGDKTVGVPLLVWPYRDLPADHQAFVAINRLAALGVLPSDPRAVDFYPDKPATKEWLKQSRDNETRGDTCLRMWKDLQESGFGDYALKRKDPTDADADGIVDNDDPLPFTPNEPIVFEIERPAATPKTDGVFPKRSADARAIQLYNFCGKDAAIERIRNNDLGEPFTKERGYGWKRDLSANHRQRNQLSGPRDTFIFTRDRDTWQLADLPNGKYRITVCVGDSGHEQLNQRVSINDTVAVNDTTTPAGLFHEATIEMVIKDGLLQMVVGSGKPGSNTCVNWVYIELIAHQESNR